MLRFVRWGSRRQRAGEPVVRSRRCSQVLGAFVAVAAVLVAAAPGAEARCGRSTNFVNSLGLGLSIPRNIFGSSSIRVTSSAPHTKTYDRIDTTSFRAEFDVNLCYPGALEAVLLHLGACTGHRGACDLAPVMFVEQFTRMRDFRRTRDFQFAIPTDSDVGQRILAMCNTPLVVTMAQQATQDIPAVPFPLVSLDITLAVSTQRDHGKAHNFVDPAGTALEYSKTRSFKIFLPVACAPLPPMAQAPPKITAAQLGVATFGDTCPKPAAATVMINAEAPRPVFYKIERGNGTTTTDDWIQGEIKLRKAPDGRQRPLLTAQHKLGKLDPGNRKFRLWIDDPWGKTPWREVKVDCPPFKVTSAWLKYDVEDRETCPRKVVETATFHTNRPGKVDYEIKHQTGLVVSRGDVKAERQGDKYLATAVRGFMMGETNGQLMADVKNSPANSGWVPLKIDCLDALSGKLTLRSLGATSCKGEALVAIHTSGAGELPYELECGPGRSWQRSVTAPANKIGVDKVRFDVKNNELVTCALRTRIGGKLKSLDGASSRFQCHRPSGVSGSNDLAPETRPDPLRPPAPGRVVADPPRVCPSGTVGRWPNCTKRACPRGTVGSWPNCRRQVCPAGTIGKWPNCRKRVCPRGTVGSWPNCRRQVCPAGTIGKWPNCRNIRRDCPRGTVGRWPHCRKAGCPPGRVRVRGRCIKPAG